MAIAAVALGSNLGARADTIAQAVDALRLLGTVQTVSPLLQTAPVGYADQPDFLNGALLLDTALTPQELLHALLRIEGEHGRDRSHGIAKGPRTLDLDLLLYDDVVMETAELTLPHPELHRRRFVLEPLAAIAPDMVHPVLQRSILELLQAL